MLDGRTWRAITNDLFLYLLLNMNDELYLDPEDTPLTPEWVEERALLAHYDQQWLEDQVLIDLDDDIQYCMGACLL
jgi:hypothetical protein